MNPGGNSRRLVLTSLVGDPALSLAILGAGAAHVALTAAGLEGWPCPFYRATGWPCPGCGLGRACVLLLHGNWVASLRLHAFAPVLLAALAILALGVTLRGAARDRFLRAVHWLEQKTAPALILLPALLIYWFLRLVLDGAHWKLIAT